MAARPPNIVLIFCDDLGYADVGCYGAKGYQTPNIDRLAKEGIRFNDFCAPHNMPHVPLHVSTKFAGKTKRGLFGDVIEEIDWSVGQILAALRKHKLDDNTLVIFTSDDGPWLSYGDHAGSVGALREGKATEFDGGVREPFIARWPGRIPKGKVCREPAMTIDLMPTFAKLTGATLPTNRIDDLGDALTKRKGSGVREPGKVEETANPR